jgi:hypothetical protein
MARKTMEEINLENQTAIENIKNSGPGTYNINYQYLHTNGYVYDVPLTITIPEGDNYSSINFNMPGSGMGDKAWVNNYLDNNDHSSIDVTYNCGQGTYRNYINIYGSSFPSLTEDLRNSFNV